MTKSKTFDTQKLVLLAILTAIVIVLQVLASVIPIYPFRLNLVLIPIVIGAAMISPVAGCWLGLVFGTVVLLSSQDVTPFMIFNPVATIGVLLLRGALTGYITGLTYNLLVNRSKTIAVLVAAAVCAIANTGLFVLGIYVFFFPVLEMWGIAGAADIASFVFLSMIGFNFLFEMGINVIVSPAIIRLIQYISEAKEQN